RGEGGERGGAVLEVREARLAGVTAIEVLQVVGDLERHPEVTAEGLEPAGDVVLSGQPPGRGAAESEQRSGLALHDAAESLDGEREVTPGLDLADGRPGHLRDGAHRGE